MDNGINNIEILFSAKIIDHILKKNDHLDADTIKHLNYLKREILKYEKIYPITNYFIRAVRYLR